jgi:hypothetical protein
MKTSDQLCYAKNKFGKPLAERKADVFEMDVDANDGGRFCFLDITVAFPASVHQSLRLPQFLSRSIKKGGGSPPAEFGVPYVSLFVEIFASHNLYLNPK